MGSKNSGPNLEGEGDTRTCSCYKDVKPYERGMKVVERVLERLCRIVIVDEKQLGSMPERGTIDAVFILRRMQKSVSC